MHASWLHNSASEMAKSPPQKYRKWLYLFLRSTLQLTAVNSAINDPRCIIGTPDFTIQCTHRINTIAAPVALACCFLTASLIVEGYEHFAEAEAWSTAWRWCEDDACLVISCLSYTYSNMKIITCKELIKLRHYIWQRGGQATKHLADSEGVGAIPT